MSEFEEEAERFRRALREAILREREACAKLIEDFQWPDAHDFASHAAAAIRARP
jgi:hypothetical protein